MAVFVACIVECDTCEGPDKSFAVVKGRLVEPFLSLNGRMPVVEPLEPPPGWQEATKLTSKYTCPRCLLCNMQFAYGKKCMLPKGHAGNHNVWASGGNP